MRSIVAIRPASRSPQTETPFARAEGHALPHDEPRGSFSEVMSRVAREVDRGENVVSRALQASPYADDAKGMIALQAGVYRYVEAVDLVTRLVDRAAGAVKTTLQNQ